MTTMKRRILAGVGLIVMLTGEQVRDRMRRVLTRPERRFWCGSEVVHSRRGAGSRQSTVQSRPYV